MSQGEYMNEFTSVSTSVGVINPVVGVGSRCLTDRVDPLTVGILQEDTPPAYSKGWKSVCSDSEKKKKYRKEGRKKHMGDFEIEGEMEGERR